MWAGLGQLGRHVASLGTTLAAICEILELECEFVSKEHPEVMVCNAFESRKWEKWQKVLARKGQIIKLLMGGIPCVILSDAGKRLEHHDPRVTQFWDTVEMAIKLKVWLLLIENVPGLVDRDEAHGIFTQLSERLEAGGLTKLEVMFLQDAICGGFTQRCRVFIFFEARHKMLALAPLWTPELKEEPRQLREILEPLEDIPKECWLQGEWNPTTAIVKPGEATLAGYVTTGTTPCLHVGDAVVLRGTKGVWTIFKQEGERVQFFLDSRKAPKYWWGTKQHIKTKLQRQVKVFSCRSVAITLRSFPVPPANWMAIWDERKQQARAMTSLEVWCASGLSKQAGIEWVEQGADVRAGTVWRRGGAAVAALVPALTPPVELRASANFTGRIASWPPPLPLPCRAGEPRCSWARLRWCWPQGMEASWGMLVPRGQKR